MNFSPTPASVGEGEVGFFFTKSSNLKYFFFGGGGGEDGWMGGRVGGG